MDKRTSLSTILIAVLLIMPLAIVGNVAAHSVRDPDDFVVATIWGPETVDPAWCYDTASGELIFNVYETLIFYEVDRSLPPAQQGKTDTFVASLATEWWIGPPDPVAPGYTNATYYFKIREDPVYFHNGEELTTADVEYSLERFLCFDRDGGPTWMFYEPLLGCYASDWSDPSWYQKIDDAIQRNSTHVWMNLAIPFPSLAFYQILAQSWCSVMPKSWAVAHGLWNGTYSNEAMMAYYNPEVSPLDDWPTGTGGRIEDGSGPYTLDAFDAIGQWYRLERYPGYWQGWPAPGCNEYGYGGACGYAEGWLETVTVRGIDEWGTRKPMFIAGDADFCYVPRQNMPELIEGYYPGMPWDDEVYPPGITCVPGLPSLAMDARFFNMNITMTGNTHVGDGAYGETGIPSWFFNDANLRKAFAYCFNYTEFIVDVYMGEGYQPPSPHVQGLAFWEYTWDTNPDGSYPATSANVDLDPPDTVLDPPYAQPALGNGTVLPPNPMYYLNTTKAIEYFQLAWASNPAGSVWDVGFTFDMLYNTGNTARRISALMLEEVIESLGNPKFHVAVYEVDWPTYLGELVAGKLTMFNLGWLADYPDPHNFFHPFMHSTGAFAGYTGYSNPEVDALIEAGILETNPDKRIWIYWKLCNVYFEESPSLAILQGVGRHWERDWVQGWYYNPIYPGNYYYHLWKGYKGDVNRDYVVDIFDLVAVASAYGTSVGEIGWNPCADVIVSGSVDIFDLVAVAAEYG